MVVTVFTMNVTMSKLFSRWFANFFHVYIKVKIHSCKRMISIQRDMRVRNLCDLNHFDLLIQLQL